MPNVTPVFLLKSINAANAVVQTFTRGYKFTGGIVITTDIYGVVTVDGSGASANAWDIFGNAGAGLVLGTNTPDDWTFIAGGLARGGFLFTGEFYLKTHVGYTDSEFLMLTAGVDTTDATLTPLFVIPVTDLTNNLITVRIVARRDTGADRAAFERKAMFYREGAGAVLSTKVHTIFTDKSQGGYDVSLSVSGNNLLVQVKGLIGHNISWVGVAEYQGVKTSA